MMTVSVLDLIFAVVHWIMEMELCQQLYYNPLKFPMSTSVYLFIALVALFIALVALRENGLTCRIVGYS
jgi:hypothetical protein